MSNKNRKVAEIVLVIAIILFIILAGITYRNLSILQEGLNVQQNTETTTIGLSLIHIYEPTRHAQI